jgi:hypothetical protein
MDYALSMVQFLLRPDWHLIHAGKQRLFPDLRTPDTS